jgi:hypothetical protein
MYQQLIFETCLFPNSVAPADEPVFRQWFPANRRHKREERGSVGNSGIDTKVMA